MKKLEKLVIVLLVILSLLPLLDLFEPGLPVTHDGQDHVARITNFYQALSEGNFIPRWAGNLNWGYGHPVIMFLYPLPSYVASLFKAIGFSFVDATKLVFGASYAASMLAMYLWVKSKWGVAAGLAASLLYGFAPYRFVDLFVRGAIGEHAAFVFPPLILWGLDGLANGKNRGVVTSLATAGLILSHNAVSLMFLPIIALYVLSLFFFGAKKNTTFLLLASSFLLIGFFLSAFFWFPAFFEGKYTLRDIVTKGEFSDRFVPWGWFFYSPWNYGGGAQFSKQLGMAQWLSIAGVVVLLQKKQKRTYISAFLLLFLVSLFLMTRWSVFIWGAVPILQKFQFPWRILSLTTFLSATAGGLVVANLPKRYMWTGAVGLSLLALVSTSTMWRAKDHQVKPETMYSDVYPGTTDTGESSPIWSVRFMEHTAPADMEVIEGRASKQALGRTTTRHEYRINATSKTRLVENTLYFPGWQVVVDGKPTEIEFQDPAWRGLMTFWVEPGEHKIEVVFGETKLRKFANTISLFGVVFLIILYAKTRFRSSSF